MTYCLWFLAFFIAMFLPVRLGFGAWHIPAHLVAATTFIAMWASTFLHREIARKFLPLESQGFLLLAANIFRILIGVLSVVIVIRLDICDFHAFLTSLLGGYVIYLSAEIYILIKESR